MPVQLHGTSSGGRSDATPAQPTTLRTSVEACHHEVAVTRRSVLLSAVLALALLPSNLVATALPLLRQEWNASATQMGWVVAAYQVGYTVAVLVFLPLTDRVPIWRVIAVGAALSAIAFLPFGAWAHDIWSASALRF